MPYLDVANQEDFHHLIQLFLAAHPPYQRRHEEIRVQLGDPHAYMVSQQMLHDMAAWGRERHLITRQAAQRMVQVADELQEAYNERQGMP